MQMLAVIVEILKIIGIILLCIIAILLILILLVLFCPWRYRVNVRKEEKLTGKVVVSWLLHIFRAEVIYLEGVNFRIRVFGLPIYDKLKREKRAEAGRENAAAKERNKAEKASDQNASGVDEQKLQPDMTAASVEEDDEPFEVLQNKDTSRKEHTEFSPKHKKRDKVWWEFPQYLFDMFIGWAEKLLELLLFLPEYVEGPTERLEKKIASVIDQVEYYTKLLQKKGSKWVMNFLKIKIFKVLSHIRPRNSRIDLYYATDDPAKVADMMAYYGMALPFLPRHTNFTAELGEPRLEGTVRVKGRIFLIVLLWHGLGIYLNKKVKTFLKLLKRETTG